MATTRTEIRGWLHEAKKAGATHMLVVCDTFDYEDYPVSVMPGESVQKMHDEYRDKPMSRVMEVYSMSRDLEEQLAEGRAFHFD